ncbi:MULTISPECIES: NAD(P)-dependent oxidoreductase [Pandoraea]|uniref:NAD(P)-dependent oxidoreductase n=1 Tax=Pandoraea TaxID=93217 RepID=UPI001F5D5769|nr:MULTISPECIES: NAD(P)-dependent oxidoreductase [Pandoraea]MCI3206384.1 NAD(P)-dependent oxidoreductase [Pandoraea sp. LA3]MDN4584412.1 NAD(P)-dependent oxidoreductase [Pandoraea capi]
MSISTEKASAATATPRQTKSVGVLGFGHMGRALTARMHEAGVQTFVYDRDIESLAALIPPGVKTVSDISGLANCDVIFTSLPDDDALNAVTKSPGGLFSVMRPNTLHIATSTVSPAMSRRLAASHHALGQRFLVAAILGNPDIVRNAQAFVLAGGQESSLIVAAPLLRHVSQRIFHIAEDPGMASLMKVASNALTGVTLQSMGEILALLAKAGIERRKGFEILTGTMFDARVHKAYGGKILEERYLPAGMTAPLAVKDLRLAMAEAEHWMVPMPLVSIVHDRLVAMMARGWADLDWSALGALAATDAGLDVNLGHTADHRA